MHSGLPGFVPGRALKNEDNSKLQGDAILLKGIVHCHYTLIIQIW